MSTRKHTPIHPGEVLKRDFMEPMGITAYRLAKDTGVSKQHVGRILLGQRGLGADVALRLAHYFGTSAELWMTMQAKYDLETAEDRTGREIKKRVKPHRAA